MKFLLAFLTALVVTQTALLAAPTITSQPQNDAAQVGANATFTVAATDSGAFTVEWSQSTDGTTFTVITDGADFTGTTTATLTVLTVDATQNGNRYRAKLTSADTSFVTSTAATLFVTATAPTAPVVTLQPTSFTAGVGQNVVFSAAASGTPTPTVQWYLKTSGSGIFTQISGATSPTLQVTAQASANGNQYQAVFTNTEGSVTTNTATLSVSSSGGGDGGGGGVDLTGGNSAGVLVYNMNFKHIAGFGIDFFKDGYVVVPATGGDGEVIFLGEEKGQRIYSRQTGVKCFFANTRNEDYSVIAMAGTSGASLSIQAYGKADDKLKANGERYTLTVRSARTMHGLAQASFDESKSTTVPADGSLGFVEFSEMKLVVDQSQTDDANKRSLTVTQKTDDLITIVKKRGYTELTLTTSSGSGDSDTGDETTTTAQ